MKQKFSMAWNSSRQVRKQRKFRARAPLHIRHKLMSAKLSKELRKKHNIKSLPIRNGDEIKVMKGKFRRKSGRVNKVNLKKLKVAVEKLQIQKKDGTKVDVWFRPSNLLITDLNMDDKKRIKFTEIKSTGKEERKNVP
ncbi:50S ribosomal protein L24 [Candidatus Pacearchaeota archaeon]|nr:50S ribosomal protein L24 [Candidatus Pacearchaeota archaeon]